MRSDRRSFSAAALVCAWLALPATAASGAAVPGCSETELSAGIFCEPLPRLTDRLAVVIEQSPRLQSRRSVGAQADFRIDEARSVRRPQFSLGLEQRNGISDIERNAFDEGSRLDAVARVSQLLFDFGASGASLDAAQLDAQAERWGILEATRQLVLAALEAHHDLVGQRARVALAEANLREHEMLLDAVQRRAEGGTGGRAEVLRAQGRLAQARAELASLRGGLARAENRYLELFFDLPGGIGLPELPDADTRDPSAGLDAVMAQHPGLTEALLRVDAAFEALKAEQRGSLPRMSLEFQGRQLNVDESSSDDLSMAVLVNIEYAPYTGGRRSALVGQANERLRQARLDRAAIQRELESAYRSAVTDVEASRASWEAQALTVDAEQAAIEGYRTQFSIGRRSLTDLLEAQRDLFQSQLLLVGARLEWDLARFRLLAMENRLLATLGLPADVLESAP